ncbi:hypothetical protein F5Y10DRAFT_235746 [Nemania abortiva]|nr:hypothetical protein F5Y10DRAFT_235746 [Nemania abortiva]
MVAIPMRAFILPTSGVLVLPFSRTTCYAPTTWELGIGAFPSLGFVDPGSLIFIALRRRPTRALPRLMLCQVRVSKAKTAASGDTFFSCVGKRTRDGSVQTRPPFGH